MGYMLHVTISMHAEEHVLAGVMINAAMWKNHAAMGKEDAAVWK